MSNEIPKWIKNVYYFALIHKIPLDEPYLDPSVGAMFHWDGIDRCRGWIKVQEYIDGKN